MLYCYGCVVSATAESADKNKAACTTNSLIPCLFSHLTIVTIPIKDSRCPRIIKYAIYTIKYPIDPTELTRWIEIANATGTQLPI